MPERAIQEMKNHLNSWREKFVHALFRHTCTLIACRNGKNDFTVTKTVTILFVHERGSSVHASRGYAARSVPEFRRSWTNNIVTITYCTDTNTWLSFWLNSLVFRFQLSLLTVVSFCAEVEVLNFRYNAVMSCWLCACKHRWQLLHTCGAVSSMVHS